MRKDALMLTLQRELPTISKPKGFLRSQDYQWDWLLFPVSPVSAALVPVSLATRMNALTDILQNNAEHRHAPSTWAAPINSPPLACPLCHSNFSSYRQKINQSLE